MWLHGPMGALGCAGPGHGSVCINVNYSIVVCHVREPLGKQAMPSSARGWLAAALARLTRLARLARLAPGARLTRAPRTPHGWDWRGHPFLREWSAP